MAFIEFKLIVCYFFFICKSLWIKVSAKKKKKQTHTCLVSSYKQSGTALQLMAVYSEDLPGNGRFSSSTSLR